MPEMYMNVVNLERVGKEVQEILDHIQEIRKLQEKLHSYHGGISVNISFEEGEGDQ